MFGRLHSHLFRVHQSITSTRDAVYWALVRLGPCTLKELREDLRGQMGRVTAYRTIRLFLEIGVAEMIRQDVIKLRAPFRQDVHYMLCEDCGREIGFNDERLERELARVAQSRRLEMRYHRVELSGLCGVCRGLS